MKLSYIKTDNEQLLNPFSPVWNNIETHTLPLYQTPLKMVEHLSPFMALSEDHGKIKSLQFKMVHNGKTASIYITWKDETRDDNIEDLDQFIDSVAVMFPMTDNAQSITMGDADNPVNMWFWRADKKHPYDVIAHGFGTSQRRDGEQLGLNVQSEYKEGHWHVVFQRNLRVNLISHQQVSFKPESVSGIAFAIWDGSNKERSAQKSFSGDWQAFEVPA